MANNCLVTKLKSVVDNDNLDYLGFTTLHITLPDGYDNANPGIFYIQSDDIQILYDQGKISDYIKVVDSDISLNISKYSTKYVAASIIANSNNKELRLLVNKYYNANMQAQNAYVFYSVEELLSLNSPILSLYRTETKEKYADAIFLNLEANKLKEITFIELRNSPFLNLSSLTHLTGLEIITLIGSGAYTGDLSAIKDLPNLQSVNVQNTNITDTENTVAYLQNRGVSVTFVGNQ